MERAEWLSARDIADVASVGLTKAYRVCQTLPHIYGGRSIRVNKAAVVRSIRETGGLPSGVSVPVLFPVMRALDVRISFSHLVRSVFYAIFTRRSAPFGPGVPRHARRGAPPEGSSRDRDTHGTPHGMHKREAA